MTRSILNRIVALADHLADHLAGKSGARVDIDNRCGWAITDCSAGDHADLLA